MKGPERLVFEWIMFEEIDRSSIAMSMDEQDLFKLRLFEIRFTRGEHFVLQVAGWRFLLGWEIIAFISDGSALLQPNRARIMTRQFLVDCKQTS